MYSNLLLTTMVGFSAMFVSATNYTHFDCGTNLQHASSHFNATIKAMHEGTHATSSGSHKAHAHSRSTTTIQVPTWFHIVYSASEAGTITQAMANAQLKAMNAAYNPHNINFVLEGTTFTANDSWASGEGQDGVDMKAALRQGTYDTLNIYFQTDLYGGILGVCTLPSNIGSGTVSPSTYVSDGCNVQANTMPGGTITGYNLGGTAIHETGHWMGLLHTFEGYSCTGSGDYISDTPVESVATSGCPAKPAKDSCTSVAGVDPIHNYMDYSDDACYEAFTPAQQVRMQSLWALYRAGR